MSDKTFAVAGWSVLKGVLKQRFAKDLDRVKVLHRNGHTDIELWELPEAMTKPAASTWLMANHPRPRPVVAEQEEAVVAEQQEEVVAEQQEEEPVTVVVENNDGSEDTVDEEALTFEAALEQIPLRENGRFLSRERREEMARELLAQA